MIPALWLIFIVPKEAQIVNHVLVTRDCVWRWTRAVKLVG